MMALQPQVYSVGRWDGLSVAVEDGLQSSFLFNNPAREKTSSSSFFFLNGESRQYSAAFAEPVVYCCYIFNKYRRFRLIGVRVGVDQRGGGTLARQHIRITEVRVTMAVIWCTFAFSAGTRFSRVMIPLKAWQFIISTAISPATVEGPPILARRMRQRSSQLTPMVTQAMFRWLNCTIARFSKKFFHRGCFSVSPEGTTSPFIRGQVLQTLPASIPATKAPVRMFRMRHLMRMMPVIRRLRRYLILDRSEGSTAVGLMRREKEFQMRPEQRVAAIPRWVASRQGLTLGLLWYSAFSLSPLLTIHHPMKPCKPPRARSPRSLLRSRGWMYPKSCKAVKGIMKRQPRAIPICRWKNSTQQMGLKPSRPISRLTVWNSTHFLYLSNSTFHSSSFLGQRLVQGDQSAMLSPECVSRVQPPSTIIPSTPAAVRKSQPPTSFSLPYRTS